MAYLDRKRAQAFMTDSNLDALLLFSPESFYYATGAAAGVATMWRDVGAVAVLIPADATTPETAVVSDLFADNFRASSPIQDVRESPIWVEATTIPDDQVVSSAGKSTAAELIQHAWEVDRRSPGFNRPTTFDPAICYQHLKTALMQQGLKTGRVGIESSAISVRDYGLLEQSISGVELVDATEVIARLKMVKSPDEIQNLRSAVTIAEAGIRSITAAIDIGVTKHDLSDCWRAAIKKAAGSTPLSGAWDYISVGTDPWGGNAAAAPGDLIKVDVGCLVDGYTSDTGRTFILGNANATQQHLFDALLAGFSEGAELIRPGQALSDVHAASLAAIRAAGFPGYTRGHFGHGLGHSVGSEQWPFISADSEVHFEPGMVMAFECPWYINGIGGMIVENQLLITDTGHEMMNQLPLGLESIPC